MPDFASPSTPNNSMMDGSPQLRMRIGTISKITRLLNNSQVSANVMIAERKTSERHAFLPSVMKPLPKRAELMLADFVPTPSRPPPKYSETVKKVGSMTSVIHHKKEGPARICSLDEISVNYTDGPAIPSGAKYMFLMRQEQHLLRAIVSNAEEAVEGLDEDVQLAEMLRRIIGHATLLLNKAFFNFRQLCVSNLKQSPQEAKVGNEDLAGCWDSLKPELAKIKRMVDDMEAYKTSGELTPCSLFAKEVASSGVPAAVKESFFIWTPEAIARDQERKSKLASLMRSRRKVMKQPSQDKQPSVTSENENGGLDADA